MARFREVLSAWCDTLSDSDTSAEKLIRKDVIKANKTLKWVTGWKEYVRSPWSFTINSIGGHIPIISNVITVINTIGELSEKYLYKRYNWVMLLKSHK